MEKPPISREEYPPSSNRFWPPSTHEALLFAIYVAMFAFGLWAHFKYKPTFMFLDQFLPRPTLTEPIGILLVWGVWIPIVTSPILIAVVAIRNKSIWIILGSVSTSVMATQWAIWRNFPNFSYDFFLDGLLLYLDGLSFYLPIFGGPTLLLCAIASALIKLLAKTSSKEN